MKYYLRGVVTLLGVMTCLPAFADSVTYSHPGTIAAQTSVYATGNGITAYYMGSTAAYQDQMEVYDVQTGYNSGKILDNKQTAVGTAFSIGTTPGQINLGDELILFILSPDGIFSNLANDSADGVNHGYMTAYSGGTANNVNIPAGLFVGMEDLKKSTSDFNYNDDTFVLTGVSAAVTPEPSTLPLLGTGLLCLAALAYHQKRRGVLI